MTEKERWLSIGVVCRRLGVTRHTAYRWIEAGHFKDGVRQTFTRRWQISERAMLHAESELARRAENNSANGAYGASL